ncbi:DUF305 domain-containing protein [Blastococcus sp. LR1]|uniref:DUF305 domain-containing protein n=1 Tax=Blastococcus sp. LR1 TaxID=2877000 RepID=UPI001CC98324|nr:DUF305 domain-containing protein [Blastococcus sp. LR1]MCA0146385.1 DUF305 domain-containing protein [Blastococcus sp. LR1]
MLLGLGDRGAPTPATDSVDAGFSRDMSRHHLQGVEMANLVAERSEDPEVESLAFDISATQTNQAGRMQGWLVLWGLTLTGGETMAWMTDEGHSGHDMSGMDMGSGALMPGMATEEELAELRGLSGTEFDVEFLRLMIRHHQGGFDMAKDAAAHAEVKAVRDLARSIEQAQGAETETMTDMLTARGGTPLPAP